MKKCLKWTLIIVFIFLGIGLAGYGGYRLYNYLIEDATRKLQKGVRKGMQSPLNPLSW